MNKTQKIKKIKAILNKPSSLPRKIEPPEFDYIYSILESHPESKQKIGCGVKNIWIKKTIYKNNGFFIERTDGTSTDFSYYRCLYGNNRKLNIQSAFRSAIRQQIYDFKINAFKNNPILFCPITEKEVSLKNCHVDHEEPTFKELLENFVEVKDIDLNKLEIGGINKDNSMNNFIVDYKIRRDWEEYHKRNAQLRITSKKGNLSRRYKC